MRILVVGGTRFVGKHLVERAIARGHEVTLFHRGRTGPDLFPGVEHLVGDRDGDLAALAGGSWDATVDTCAYLPRQVNALADVLGRRGGHHLLVSSVSAYAAPDGPGLTESDARLVELDDPAAEEVTAATYGGLKVLCERAAVERYGDETTLVRPTYVIGPDDYTWRFPWWVRRVACGGEVALPEPADAPVQLIDVRDLGDFMIGLLEREATGAFHACAPQPVYTWRELAEELVATVGPSGTEVRWVPTDVLATHDLPAAALPLYGGQDPDVWLMGCDASRALAAGLNPRPLAESVRDTLAWCSTASPPAGIGLDASTEAALLADLPATA